MPQKRTLFLLPDTYLRSQLDTCRTHCNHHNHLKQQQHACLPPPSTHPGSSPNSGSSLEQSGAGRTPGRNPMGRLTPGVFITGVPSVMGSCPLLTGIFVSLSRLHTLTLLHHMAWALPCLLARCTGDLEGAGRMQDNRAFLRTCPSLVLATADFPIRCTWIWAKVHIALHTCLPSLLRSGI